MTLIGIIVVVLMSLDSTTAQEGGDRPGYRIWRNQILIEDANHWRHWDSPIGVRTFDENGTVRPRFMRRNINAAINAPQFINTAGTDTVAGGISAVGTPADSVTAAAIIDGDDATFWEPHWATDDSDELNNLWVELNLGRTVIAQRLVVRFVEEGLGDPFLRFRVLVSDGSNVFGRSKKRRFVRVAQVTRANKDQREFTFDIAPLRPVPTNVVGAAIQFVRIDLLDTDGQHAEEVSSTAYARLTASDRGAIDHFRRTVTGRQIQVVEETYDVLPAAEKGNVRYYRREHPRLAELEVHTVGDNVVTITQQALFGDKNFFKDIAKQFITDGMLYSQFGLPEYDRLRNRNQVTIDLGGKFWLDRINLLFLRDPLNSYQLHVSDGSREATGEFLWHDFDERLNEQGYLQQEEHFPLREVRYIELRRLNLLRQTRGGRNIAELQAYGEGYVSELTMTSPIIQLDQRLMFMGLHWDGEQPVGTRLNIRSRSGDELIQIPHYFTRDGREVSEALYERLTDSDQGRIHVEYQEGADWSPWSEFYRDSGEQFKSPTPRRHTRLQVSLITDEPLRHATLRRLNLELAPPLVDSTVAEIAPRRGIEPGTNKEFRIYFKPISLPDDPGFTRLRLASSSSSPIVLQSIRRGSDDELRFGGAESLWPGQLQLELLENGNVDLVFPKPPKSNAGTFELRFRTKIFLPSTVFSLQLSHPIHGRLIQTVDPGDASSLMASNSLVVVSNLDGVPLLDRLSVEPRLFSPNGDGLNDRVTIRFSVFQIEARQSRALKVEISDLGGRSVRILNLKRAGLSGEHLVHWDGHDAGGILMAPGIYLLRVTVPTDVDIRGASKISTVHMAY